MLISIYLCPVKCLALYLSTVLPKSTYSRTFFDIDTLKNTTLDNYRKLFFAVGQLLNYFAALILADLIKAAKICAAESNIV